MSGARENEIGRCTCPVCKSTRARLRVSAKQLAYVTCDSCNAQVFSRSDRSDDALRALHIKDEPVPAQAGPASPPPVEPAAINKAPTKAPNEPEAERRRDATGLGWGFLS